MSGSRPAEYAYQLAFSAFAMFRKKIRDLASTVSPLDHFQPFMLTTTVLPPLVYTGRVGGRQRVVDGHVGVGVVAEHVQRPVHQPLELLVVVDAGVRDRVEREDPAVGDAGRQRHRRRPALDRRAAPWNCPTGLLLRTDRPPRSARPRPSHGNRREAQLTSP